MSSIEQLRPKEVTAVDIAASDSLTAYQQLLSQLDPARYKGFSFAEPDQSERFDLNFPRLDAFQHDPAATDGTPLHRSFELAAALARNIDQLTERVAGYFDEPIVQAELAKGTPMLFLSNHYNFADQPIIATTVLRAKQASGLAVDPSSQTIVISRGIDLLDIVPGLPANDMVIKPVANALRTLPRTKTGILSEDLSEIRKQANARSLQALSADLNTPGHTTYMAGGGQRDTQEGNKLFINRVPLNTAKLIAQRNQSGRLLVVPCVIDFDPFSNAKPGELFAQTDAYLELYQPEFPDSVEAVHDLYGRIAQSAHEHFIEARGLSVLYRPEA